MGINKVHKVIYVIDAMKDISKCGNIYKKMYNNSDKKIYIQTAIGESLKEIYMGIYCIKQLCKCNRTEYESMHYNMHARIFKYNRMSAIL